MGCKVNPALLIPRKTRKIWFNQTHGLKVARPRGLLRDKPVVVSPSCTLTLRTRDILCHTPAVAVPGHRDQRNPNRLRVNPCVITTLSVKPRALSLKANPLLMHSLKHVERARILAFAAVDTQVGEKTPLRSNQTAVVVHLFNPGPNP